MKNKRFLNIKLKLITSGLGRICIAIILLATLLMFGCIKQPKDSNHNGYIVLENTEMRLAINKDGRATSLIHKPTGEECLKQNLITPFCSISYLRRDDAMVQRYTEARGDHYPRCEKNAEHTLFSNSVTKQGDKLIIGFEGVIDTLVLKVKISNSYINFFVEELKTLKTVTYEEITFLQLPVKERTYFGDWLNVMWDDKVAVNVLATNPGTRICSERRTGFQELQAMGERKIALEGIGAALIVTNTNNLLDCIAQVEEDFNLPRGVESRRQPECLYSYYWAEDLTPGNMEEHIQYAQMGGFKGIMVSYHTFTKGAGHWEFNEKYPRGIEDLKNVVEAIKSSGLTSGLHCHYNKAHKWDSYVSGTPHPGLHLSDIFTLSKPIDSKSGIITVEENPAGITLDEGRRILRIGNELIQYEGYTTKPPYQFFGCRRAVLETKAMPCEAGFKIGVLDVDTWNVFVRFDQRSSLQEEVAKRIAWIYNNAGFEIIYYDGAEDVHPPDWYNYSAAQLKIHEKLSPQPKWAEGAGYSHFSWHILSRGNPWDTQASLPEVLKHTIREESAAQAPRMMENFTNFTFVRLAYHLPGEETIGIQPDMIEYACSRGAAWDCPISIWTELDNFKNHPRTKDNLEVCRRWGEVITQGWLTEGQKESLRDLHQEHILLINEDNGFELQTCNQIQVGKNNMKQARAFIFNRGRHPYVVLWHTSGQGKLNVPIIKDQLILRGQIGGAILPVKETVNGIVLPFSDRCYLEFENMTKERVIEAFQKATDISTIQKSNN